MYVFLGNPALLLEEALHGERINKMERILFEKINFSP
jgi:hypothetical protein